MKRIAVLPAAVDQHAKNTPGVLIGLKGIENAATPLGEVVNCQKSLDPRLLEMARVLAH